METRNIRIGEQNYAATPIPERYCHYCLDDNSWVLIRHVNQNLLENECNFYNKLREHGLQAPRLETKLIYMDDLDNPIPAMISPNYDTLSKTGKQVRFSDQPRLSRGNSLIFGSKEKVNDIDHWRIIFKDINKDMATYLLSPFNLITARLFNLVIEDNAEKSFESRNDQAKVFSELNQTLHLYFANFHQFFSGTKIQYRCFIDSDGNFLEEDLTNHIEKMYEQIETVFIYAISLPEEKLLTGRLISFDGLSKLIIPVLKKIWEEVIKEVANEVKNRLMNMNAEERKKYSIPPIDPEIAKRDQAVFRAVLDDTIKNNKSSDEFLENLQKAREKSSLQQPVVSTSQFTQFRKPEIAQKEAANTPENTRTLDSDCRIS